MGAVPFLVALAAAIAVSFWPRRAALLVVAAWAFVAAPLVPTVSDRGFSARVPGKVIGTASEGLSPPGGTQLLHAGALPLGATRLSRATPNELLPTGRYDLVAWSVVLLPWPHVDRTTIATYRGALGKSWLGPVTLARDGHRLLVVGKQPTPRAFTARINVRGLGFGISPSSLTYLGWALLALALLGRFTQIPGPDRAPRDRRRDLRAFSNICFVLGGGALLVGMLAGLALLGDAENGGTSPTTGALVLLLAVVPGLVLLGIGAAVRAAAGSRD